MDEKKANRITYKAMQEFLKTISELSQRVRKMISESESDNESAEAIFRYYEGRLGDPNIEGSEIWFLHSLVEFNENISLNLTELGAKKFGEMLREMDPFPLHVEMLKILIADLENLVPFLHDYQFIISTFVDSMLTIQTISQMLIDKITQIDESGITPELAESLIQEMKDMQFSPDVIGRLRAEEKIEASIPEQIEHLARLRDQGILSDEEFEGKRKELLSKM